MIPILSLGAMLIGVLFSSVYPKGDRRRGRATAIFVLGAVVLLANWLMQEPDVLLDLRRNVGWVLLGLVITFVKIIRR